MSEDEIVPFDEDEIVNLELILVMERMENGLKSTNAVKDTSMKRETADRAFKAVMKGEDPFHRSNGRPRKIPTEVEDRIRGESIVNDQLIRSHTLATYKDRAIFLMKELAKLNPKKMRKSESDYIFCEDTWMRSFARALPERGNSSYSKNNRRSQCLNDAYNPISFAATVMCMDLSEVPPELITNWDVSSILLGDDGILTKIRLAPGSKAKLKSKGLNAGAAPPEGGQQKKRSLQVGTLISPAGSLLFTAIMIAERSAKEIVTHVVSVTLTL